MTELSILSVLFFFSPSSYNRMAFLVVFQSSYSSVGAVQDIETATTNGDASHVQRVCDQWIKKVWVEEGDSQEGK